MKKLLFLLPFCAFLSVAALNAQSCHGTAASTTGSAGAGKACCANKAACATKAAAAASADATIEKRMADDGSVSYVRKEADAQGNARFVSVQFDEASNAFVNVAPKTMTAEDKAGTTKKACSAGSGKKACCAGGGSGKACAGKGEAKAEQ